MRLPIVITVGMLLVLNPASVHGHRVRADHVGAGSRFDIRIKTYGRISRNLTDRILAELHMLHNRIGHDLVTYPARLTVHIYSTHLAYARALWAAQRQRPQSDTDDSSSIVHATLLLGPLPPDYQRHNLAHVYTEWLIDRVTGNLSDALPSDPWIYDGLAEYEAYRYAAAGLPCAARGSTPLDVTRIRTARRWRQIRAGPLGALEYCLAYLRVRHIVSRVGWPCVEAALHAGGWSRAAARLRRLDQSGRCVPD